MISEIGGQLGWLASEMKFTYKKPVYIGETISCTLTLTRVDNRRRAEAVAVFRNREDTVVLEASLKGVLPGPGELKVMAAMLTEEGATKRN